MTTIVSPPHHAASWKERALAKSEIITDAWDVTKTYAGRIAEWVLFGCMIMNIIEILPGVSLWPALSNIVLGTQVVMLDVGGFSLASMGEQAREQGDERAAHRASITSGFLIGIMIVTLLLVSIGLLWPATAPYTNVAEKGLILVRVVMTVIYGHVIHSLRRTTQAVHHLQVTEVYDRLDAYSEQLRLVQAQMQQVLEVPGPVSTLVQSEVQAQTHTLMSELQAVHSHFQDVQSLVQSLTSRLLEAAEVQEQQDSRLSRQGREQTRMGTGRGSPQPITRVHSTREEAGTEQVSGRDSEPLAQRIKEYILEQRRQGREPSLAEIRERCACSKGSAIRYRRELDTHTAVDERSTVSA